VLNRWFYGIKNILMVGKISYRTPTWFKEKARKKLIKIKSRKRNLKYLPLKQTCPKANFVLF
jgi:hypothetical protein